MNEMFPHLKQRSPVVNSSDWTLIWKDTHLSIQGFRAARLYTTEWTKPPCLTLPVWTLYQMRQLLSGRHLKATWNFWHWEGRSSRNLSNSMIYNFEMKYLYLYVLYAIKHTKTFPLSFTKFFFLFNLLLATVYT